jgi:hypothetical protein
VIADWLIVEVLEGVRDFDGVAGGLEEVSFRSHVTVYHVTLSHLTAMWTFFLPRA